MFLKEGEQVGIVDPETGAEQLDLLEDERQFDATEVEREDHRAGLQPQDPRGDQEVRRWSTSSDYGRFPKTLIFAANDLPHTSHADQLVDTGARRLRPRRFVRAEDHRRASTGRCSASASSATGPTPASS